LAAREHPHPKKTKEMIPMKALEPLVVAALLAAVILSSTGPAHADLTAQQVWQRAIQRIRSVKDYTLSYNYTGPKGQYEFQYAVVRPNEVKTRIIKGENAGAVLIYNPNEFGNEVRARKGFLGKGINLNDPKVANTPIIQPVYDMLLERTRNGSPTLAGNEVVMGHPVYVLTVNANGTQHTVAIDKQTFDVLHWKYQDNEGVQDRTFYDIKVNVHPRIDF
jgi:outer membrane lipoprotein-sorting protein